MANKKFVIRYYQEKLDDGRVWFWTFSVGTTSEMVTRRQGIVRGLIVHGRNEDDPSRREYNFKSLRELVQKAKKSIPERFGLHADDVVRIKLVRVTW